MDDIRAANFLPTVDSPHSSPHSSPVLPPVVNEGSVFPFKFWFNHTVQDGMYYRNELFYRLHTVGIGTRAQLYHYACRLARRDNVVVTASERQCSIWVSLRSPSVTALTLRRQPLPPALHPDASSSNLPPSQPADPV
jgi:hypothetical protein